MRCVYSDFRHTIYVGFHCATSTIPTDPQLLQGTDRRHTLHLCALQHSASSMWASQHIHSAQLMRVPRSVMPIGGLCAIADCVYAAFLELHMAQMYWPSAHRSLRLSDACHLQV